MRPVAQHRTHSPVHAPANDFRRIPDCAAEPLRRIHHRRRHVHQCGHNQCLGSNGTAWQPYVGHSHSVHPVPTSAYIGWHPGLQESKGRGNGNTQVPPHIIGALRSRNGNAGIYRIHSPGLHGNTRAVPYQRNVKPGIGNSAHQCHRTLP